MRQQCLKEDECVLKITVISVHTAQFPNTIFPVLRYTGSEWGSAAVLFKRSTVDDKEKWQDRSCREAKSHAFALFLYKEVGLTPASKSCLLPNDMMKGFWRTTDPDRTLILFEKLVFLERQASLLSMPLSTSRHVSSVLLFEFPNVVQSNILLYYKFTRCPHVVLDQFVCIAQEDYWRILNHVEKNMHKVEEEGEIVMVKEHRELDRSGTRKGHIVIKVSGLKKCYCFIYFVELEGETFCSGEVCVWRL